jgi:hypothetical protein
VFSYRFLPVVRLKPGSAGAAMVLVLTDRTHETAIHDATNAPAQVRFEYWCLLDCPPARQIP